MLSRRSTFLGLSGVLAMPAIARSQSLMRLSPLRVDHYDVEITLEHHDDGSCTIVKIEQVLNKRRTSIDTVWMGRERRSLPELIGVTSVA